MDFLDPQKKRAHKIRIGIGYVLMVIMIGLATTILLYQAYGYGLDKNGQVIQNGLVFVTSTPNPASIYLNGELNKAKTNSRLVLPAGQYTLKIQKDGYRTWQRAVGVEGGSVERFDYPFLFPTTLSTATVKAYTAQPGLLTQSPDRHWLVAEETATSSNFDVYNLNNRKLAPTVISLPATAFGNTLDSTSWQLGEWSTDNRHVLLQRQFAGGSEFIMVDTQTPALSVNLTKMLSLTPTQIPTLHNEQFDEYYIYDSAAATLGTNTLAAPTVVPVLGHVLSYKTFATNDILYATDTGAAAGKAVVRLQQGSKNVAVRTVAAGSQYLLNLTQYSGVWYVAAGAAAEDRVYVYKNPVGNLQSHPDLPLVPAEIMKVTQPNYLDFSANARFIVTESGQSFAVYDILNDKAYSYQVSQPIDASAHATWMDGDRLMFTSDNKVTVFDYDDANQQTLSAAQTGSLPFFDKSYQYLYDLLPADATGAVNLTRTALTVPPAP